ncbi:DUF1015 domain-containing protein [Aquiflexum gelatinilyticum]|uniref:DUF1015 domain-containing protein n=1 Tax=Aquiflexum gelatinilyticum TaxID=2961943 RepID=A0A9X2P3V9_9BACT|nr:DUF1015 domain-containing protein [Aquiflexum gelatinilyticum]MCR9015446.1 DUF1015 domain-containing protein [Aquiflexum gelatinilyticum]
MAEILPIKAWRYHDSLKDRMEDMISPLFDVVSQKQRQALYENPFNSIHLSVPLGENPALSAKAILENWKNEAVITQDQMPGIYVYYQYFKLPGEEKEFCKKGFIAQIKAYDWHEGVVLRHENTIPKSVNDRVEMLKSTKFQPSPTHGLYEDPMHILEPFMDEAIQDPIYDLEDYQGVREVLAVIHDLPTIRIFLEQIASKSIILADGHHRYEAAIKYRNDMTASNPEHRGDEAYNYHLMYFTNAHSKDLRILPTHRLFTGISLDENDILSKAEDWFNIRKVYDSDEISELILHKQWAFGLVFKDSAYKIRLKPEKFEEFELAIPDVVKSVDLMVLHYFFIEKVMGIKMEEQRFSEKLEYERNLRRCVGRVGEGSADFAVITKEVSMSQVLEVCKSGFMMPQKTTYFYPKTVSGLLFASVDEQEFKFPYQAFRP